MLHELKRVQTSLLITCSFLLLWVAATAFAQEPSKRWKSRNDRGNRWEGRIEIPVGRPTIDLLSFFGSRESYRDGEDLTVRFFMPDVGDVKLQARELEERVQYFMEAKAQDWAAGAWNTFGPWPSREILAREDIPAGNLAVLIRLIGGGDGDEDEDKGETLLPAFVYHSSPPESLETYTLHVRPSSSLSQLVYRLHHGDQELRHDKLVDLDAFVPLAIKLKAADLPQGRLRLDLDGKPRGRVCGTENSTPCPHTSLVFYHQPVGGPEAD